jgi:hypothetical protein
MEVSNNQPNLAALPLGGFMPTNQDIIEVRNIDGLGPVKSNISSTPFATGRGALHQGSAVESRNIVLTLGLNPDWKDQTISSLRRMLYRYFMTEAWVKLRFISDDMPSASIRGQVESFEPNIFSQDPEMQVSIICNKPDFIEDNSTVISGTSLPIAGVNFDSMVYETMVGAKQIAYPGTAPAGFVLRITEGYSGPLAFFNATPDGVQYMWLDAVGIAGGHRFELSTVRSERYVYDIDIGAGTAYNQLAKMSKAADDWPEWAPGANRFAVYSTGGGLDWTLAFLARYGGL